MLAISQWIALRVSTCGMAPKYQIWAQYPKIAGWKHQVTAGSDPVFILRVRRLRRPSQNIEVQGQEWWYCAAESGLVKPNIVVRWPTRRGTVNMIQPRARMARGVLRPVSLNMCSKMRGDTESKRSMLSTEQSTAISGSQGWISESKAMSHSSAMLLLVVSSLVDHRTNRTNSVPDL